MPNISDIHYVSDSERSQKRNGKEKGEGDWDEQLVWVEFLKRLAHISSVIGPILLSLESVAKEEKKKKRNKFLIQESCFVRDIFRRCGGRFTQYTHI